MLAWPTMVMPDEQFINNYRSYVPDIQEGLEISRNGGAVHRKVMKGGKSSGEQLL